MIRWAFVPNSTVGHQFTLLHSLIQLDYPKLLILFQILYVSEGSMGAALQHSLDCGQKPKERHQHPAPGDVAVGEIASMPSNWPTLAPALFNHYAEALNWIIANNYGAQLLYYLDYFLLVGPPGKDTCPEAMSRVLLVCDRLLGIPVASEKLEGPTTTLTFLGIVLNTSEQQLHLPRDKLQLR